MPSFEVYCDESYITDSRYRGVAAVSLAADSVGWFGAGIAKLMGESSVTEFKWTKLTDAKYRFAALKLLDHVVASISHCALRVDVLVWDTFDRRHQIPNRDDNANLERMFFHLLKAVMGKRVNGSQWHVFPDEKFGMDWGTIKACLQAIARRSSAIGVAEEMRRSKHTIHRFRSVRSHEQPLVQVADLFCGLAVFSRLKFGAFRGWNDALVGQGSLFDGMPSSSMSQGDVERFKVLQQFKDRLDAAGLGVSLSSTGGLRTMNPTQPLNFWWYEPQHVRDKAPAKARR